MKQVSFILSVLVSSLGISLASFAIQPAIVHPSRPSSCFDQRTQRFYEDGESWQNGCSLSSCTKVVQNSKAQMMISHESCGKVGYEPNCYVRVSDSSEYPECCPEVVCPDSVEDILETQPQDISNDLHSSEKYEDVSSYESQPNGQLLKFFDILSKSKYVNYPREGKFDEFQNLNEVQNSYPKQYWKRKSTPSFFFV